MIKNLMTLASDKKPSRNLYYEEVFVKMLSGKKLSWNWFAFFFTFQWMLYRKIYGIGFLSLVLFVVLTISPLYMLQNVWKIGPAYICIISVISAFFLIGAFGNYIYYAHLRRKINKGYHQVETIKSTDKVSVFISFFFLPFGFVSGAIISILDYAKERKISLSARIIGTSLVIAVLAFADLNFIKSSRSLRAAGIPADATATVMIVVRAGSSIGNYIYYLPLMDLRREIRSRYYKLMHQKKDEIATNSFS